MKAHERGVQIENIGHGFEGAALSSGRTWTHAIQDERGNDHGST